MTDKIIFSTRINKYLALHNYASRREADVLISKGLVKINGKKASLGDKVFEGDRVEVKNSQKLKDNKYYVYYKPKGIETILSKQNLPLPRQSPDALGSGSRFSRFGIGEHRDIKEVAGFPKGFFPVGRLDKDSHGIIIMTNDGRITSKLLDPEKEHEKEYVIKVDKDITNFFIKRMASGVRLEDPARTYRSPFGTGGFTTKKCAIKKINEKTFSIILTEGKKHQIRRMCAALGYQVRDLKRVRIMNVKIGSLKQGRKRELQGAELSNFLKKLGLEK
jgi:23S rRNA pseudouridine2604 synthase